MLAHMCPSARTRSHPVHTPSCARTGPHTHAHTGRARSHPEHTPSCARTHRSAHTLTPLSERRGGAGAAAGAPPAPPGEGAAQGTAAGASVFAPAGTGRRLQGARPSGCSELGCSEGARPGHPRVRERSAAGGAPWTPRREAARRRTAWTPARKLEGEPRQAGPWAGSLSESRGSPDPARDLLGPRRGAGAAAAEWGGGDCSSRRLPQRKPEGLRWARFLQAGPEGRVARSMAARGR